MKNPLPAFDPKAGGSSAEQRLGSAAAVAARRRQRRQVGERLNWTGAFALSWSIWLGGAAFGFALVEWTKGLPIELPESPSVGVDAARPAAAGSTAAGIGQERPPAGEADSFLDLFLLILGRNLAVYVWLLTGLVSAGATTFAVLLYNGVGLGQVIGFAAWLGLPAGAIADLLLPHGMLELGAFCIGGAVGFQGFRLALGAHRPSWESVKALRLGLVLAFGVCALALAAAVEASVTAELAASHGVRPPGEPLAGEQCGSRRT